MKIVKEFQVDISFKINPKKHFPPNQRTKEGEKRMGRYAMKCVEDMLRSCCDFPLLVRVKILNPATGADIVKDIQL